MKWFKTNNIFDEFIKCLRRNSFQNKKTAPANQLTDSFKKKQKIFLPDDSFKFIFSLIEIEGFFALKFISSVIYFPQVNDGWTSVGWDISAHLRGNEVGDVAPFLYFQKK